MTKITLTPANDLIKEIWGEIGTSKRDEMEAKLKEEVDAYCAREAIEDEGLNQNLS